jgi:hypothetical protein
LGNVSVLEAALYDTMRQRIDLRRREKRVDAAVLGAGAAILVLGVVAVAGASTWLSKREPAPPGPVRMTVGAQSFVVDSRWLRGRTARGGRVTLAISWGEITQAPEASEPSDVLFTIGPADGSTPPADRPNLLYARFLTAATVAAEGGLVRREFRAGSPFEGEALYLSPPQGRLFAARCPIASPGQPAESRCVAEFRVADLDVLATFEPALLPNWDTLSRAARRLVENRGKL